MTKIRVHLGKRSYDILIGCGLLKEAGSTINKLNIGNDAVVITSKRISAIYGKALEEALKKSAISIKFEFVPDSERAKSAVVLTRLLNRIAAYDKNKKLFIIALGGGVVGDLAGFTASIYKRGVPYVQIPTTLLSQVDSAIGGKVAIDLPAAKNLAGSFYQPMAVISDVSTLKTLPKRQIRNGLAECIKYGVIKNKRLFAYLEKNCKKLLSLEGPALEYVIATSAGIKASVVKEDEFDNMGRRVILNYGHTLGHAIEAASGYSHRYHHGEAIAIGMVIAARISLKMGLIKKAEVLRIENLIRRSGLPTRIKGLNFSAVYNAHFHDKKFIHGRNRLVLPTGIGKTRVVENIPTELLIKAIKENMMQE